MFIKMWWQIVSHKKIGTMVKNLSLEVKVKGSNPNSYNLGLNCLTN
jgi:hypothetical protein